MVTVEDVRAFAITLPRSTEAFVRGRIKFRVGRIVYLAFSRDETLMGFGFPKEWREALVESEPDFMLPRRPTSVTTGRSSGSRRSTSPDARPRARRLADGRAPKVAAEYERSHRRVSVGGGSALELGPAPLEEASLLVRVDELERAVVGARAASSRPSRRRSSARVAWR